MENVESEEPDGAVAGRFFRLEESPRGFRKGGFDGSIAGVEKTEAGHRPAGEGIIERMGRVLPMDETRVAQEMDVDESQQDEQAEACAELLPRPLDHVKIYSAIPGAPRQLEFRLAQPGRKGSLQDERNFTFGGNCRPQTDSSGVEALVRKRESLLEFIYERRKGEGFSFPGRN